jgi:hypothetical protein
MQKQKQGKREKYMIQIGPLLLKALDEQISKIKDLTYDSVKPSYYEAGEVLAKKILGLV